MPATQRAASYTLGDQLDVARAITDRLFEVVRPQALYERPVPERHRLIFYLGHLEAFDWNLIGRYGCSAPAFHSEFDQLFAFGIDPEPGKAAADQPSDWPEAGEVRRYNARVRETLDRLLPETPDQLVHVAIEHRLMHAETLAYLFHNLPLDAKVAPKIEPVPSRPAPGNPMLEIPAGRATLGRPRNDGFGWDNEFEEHAVDVPAFRISKHKITNGEYLEFVGEGAAAPHFWTARDGRWFYRGMFAEIPLPLDWPVYLTHEEACAYAQWAGMQLPTEAQFHRAAWGTPVPGQERRYPWGEAAPTEAHGNFDFCQWDPVPVTATPAGDSAFGVSQLVGNGWEWTSTVFGPFPGFEPFPFYRGYSADFFDGRHYVLKGASSRTAACMLRRTFRNWFRPNYPYVYAGFRLVESR